MSDTLSDEQIAWMVSEFTGPRPVLPCRVASVVVQALRELQQRRALAAVQAQPASECACNCHSPVLANDDGMACDHCKPEAQQASARPDVEALPRYLTVENSDGNISASLRPRPNGEWLRREDVLALLARVPAPAVSVEQLEQIAKETAERIGAEAIREFCWEAEYQPTEAAVIILAALQRARAPQGEQP